MSADSFLSVIIASKGRPEMLQGTITCLMRQTQLADEIIVAVTGEEDYLPELLSTPRLRLVISPAGSSIQRNRAINELHPDSVLTAFLDDDVELEEQYLEKVCAYLLSNPDIAGQSGAPLLDRPQGGRMSREEAQPIIRNKELDAPQAQPTRCLFGCNMTIRSAYVRHERFDERLALYGWMEDRDYTSRIAKYGRTVYCTVAKFIHFGSPAGRVSEQLLGYAQIMNSTYLLRKGVLNRSEFKGEAINPLLANTIRSIGLRHPRGQDVLTRQERRLRLSGNLLAIRDIATKGAQPELILGLKNRYG